MSNEVMFIRFSPPAVAWCTQTQQTDVRKALVCGSLDNRGATIKVGCTGHDSETAGLRKQEETIHREQ